MKRILFAALCLGFSCPAISQETAITALPEVTSPSNTDDLVIVNGGVTRKIERGNLVLSDAEVANKPSVQANTTHSASTANPHSVTAAQIGVADGATANDTDTNLRDRATHTGSQPLSTISDSGALAALDDIDALALLDGALCGTNEILEDQGAGWVCIATPGGGGGGAVSSVNTQTGVVVLDADDLDDASTSHKYVTAADLTNLGNLSGTNTGDQDISGISTNSTDISTLQSEQTTQDAAITSATARPATVSLEVDDCIEFYDDNNSNVRACATVSDINVSNPDISEAAGAPSSTPGKVGDIYIDTTNGDSYVAIGTGGSGDWKNTEDAGGSESTTVSDTATVDLTLASDNVSGIVVLGSLDESHLDASVNASLDLADSAVQTDTNTQLSDSDVEAAYNNQVGQVSAAEISAGTEPSVRRFSPDDIEAMIQAHAVGGSSQTESFIVPLGDETTDHSTGTDIFRFRMPYAFTVTDVRLSCNTAPTGATLFTADVSESGVSILSTLVTLDDGESTSTTAATPYVLSDTALADDAEISVAIVAVGDTTAGAGCKLTIIGNQ